MARISLDKKSLTKIFFSYGIHLWLIVFLMNVGLYYVAHFYTIGSTCFTTAQVSSDSRCLYILSGKVYQKGSRSSPHMGHPCGSDISSVLPPSHGGNQAKYLLPNYVGDICTAAPTPTPTTKPIPTNTPVPTATKAPIAPTNTLVPTNSPVPTSAPVNTTVPTPTTKPTTIPLVPTATTVPQQQITLANPTATSVPVTQPTTVPTIANTSVPTPTSQIYPTITPTATPIPLPTPIPLVGPGVSFAFSYPGIVQTQPPTTPIHQTKQITLLVYKYNANISNSSEQPLATITTQALYDGNSTSNSYGSFVVSSADVGSSVPSGTYQIVFKTNQSTKTPLKDTATNSTQITLTQGQNALTVPEMKSLLVGEVNGDNIINIQDYNILVSCFGSKVTQQPSCPDPAIADFNADGNVDGVDYILMLYGIRTQSAQNGQLVVTKPSPTAMPLAKATQAPTPTSAFAMQFATPTTKVIKITKKVNKIPTPTPTPQPKPKLSLFAGANGVSVSKVVSYIFFFLLIIVAIFGAFKSRLLSNLLHRSSAKSPATTVAPQAQPTAVEASPPAKSYYVTINSQTPVNGQYQVTLTDSNGAKPGYTTQLPSQNGYYDVTGTEQDINGAPAVMITTITASNTTN